MAQTAQSKTCQQKITNMKYKWKPIHVLDIDHHQNEYQLKHLLICSK